MNYDPIQSLIMFDASPSGGENLDFLIESEGGFESSYDVTLGQTANQHASPAGRMLTSVTRTENDKITINGWIRCIFCNGSVVDTSDYLVRLKKTIEKQKWQDTEMATIVNNDGVFKFMRLSSVSWNRNGDLPQDIGVTMSWEQVNIAGDLASPAYSLGGLQT